MPDDPEIPELPELLQTPCPEPTYYDAGHYDEDGYWQENWLPVEDQTWLDYCAWQAVLANYNAQVAALLQAHELEVASLIAAHNAEVASLLSAYNSARNSVINSYIHALVAFTQEAGIIAVPASVLQDNAVLAAANITSMPALISRLKTELAAIPSPAYLTTPPADEAIPGSGTLDGALKAEFQRGPDMGGGVGGLLYSLRSSGIQNQASSIRYNLSNARGDVVAQTDASGELTWTASYEAYGKRPVETGANADRQRANTKEEDPTGLLNEGFRYRDLETGTWLSRDPAGFVDGPNLYCYVRQNPWTKFDPEGLEQTKAGVTITREKHHISPVNTWDSNGLSKDVQERLNHSDYRIGKDGVPHGAAGHSQYCQRADAITKGYIAEKGIDPRTLKGKAAIEYADGLVGAIENSSRASPSSNGSTASRKSSASSRTPSMVAPSPTATFPTGNRAASSNGSVFRRLGNGRAP